MGAWLWRRQLLLNAAKNAGTTETDRVIQALEGLEYDYYKGPQFYRKCDHQSVQSVSFLAVKSGAG